MKTKKFHNKLSQLTHTAATIYRLTHMSRTADLVEEISDAAKICQRLAFAPHLNFKREKSSTDRARDTDAKRLKTKARQQKHDIKICSKRSRIHLCVNSRRFGAILENKSHVRIQKCERHSKIDVSKLTRVFK